jgi:hypothetical protein
MTARILSLSILLAGVGACSGAAVQQDEGAAISNELSYGKAGHYGATMRATSGHGGGLADVQPVATGAGFAADITVVLVDVAASSVYTIARAPEIGRPLNTDGICQRANGQYPWEQPNSAGFPAAPAFPTFVLPATATQPATNVTITTDNSGFGYTQFHFDAPSIPHGTVFDVEFRALDASGASTILSDCFQVTAL